MDINVSILIAVVGCLVGLSGWLRNHDNDNKADATLMTRLETKIDSIAECTRDIKTEITSLKTDVKSLDKRLTIAETKIEAMWKKIDKGENK